MAAKPQTTSFDDLMRICQQRGVDVLVEFTGGISALEATAIEQIRPRPLRWRDRENDAEGGDWIRGDRFRHSVIRRRAATASTAGGANEGLKNYADRAGSLHEILAICERQGAAVIVGFEGGRGALRRSTRAVLLARQFYKWDWVDRSIGAKDPSNWITGDEFSAIVGSIS